MRMKLPANVSSWRYLPKKSFVVVARSREPAVAKADLRYRRHLSSPGRCEPTYASSLSRLFATVKKAENRRKFHPAAGVSKSHESATSALFFLSGRSKIAVKEKDPWVVTRLRFEGARDGAASR